VRTKRGMVRRLRRMMRRAQIDMPPRQGRDQDYESADPARRARLFGLWRDGRATFPRPVTDDEPCESFQHGCAYLITPPLCHTRITSPRPSCARLFVAWAASPQHLIDGQRSPRSEAHRESSH
jgi:hypothetical protein